MHEPLSLQYLAVHLAGQITLGTYLLTADNTCRFAVFDDDQPGGLVRLAQLAAELEHREGVRTLLEMSRRAGHLWVHLVEPTAADRVHAWQSEEQPVHLVEQPWKKGDPDPKAQACLRSFSTGAASAWRRKVSARGC